MNFVFLSPHFPPNYHLFCQRLKAEGFTVLAIGEPEFGELRPELREALAWYHKVDNLHNYEELAAACHFFTGRFGPIDRLDSLNEYWLETEAKLRTEFGVKGIQTDTIADIRRKSRMKKIFSTAGIAHARGRMVHTPADILALASETGWPVIVKPDDGMGAAFTYKLENAAQADEFFARKPDREFIAEEFIDGDIVTFDGLADTEGKIIFYTSHIYGEGVMESVLADSHIYYYSAREIPADLEKAGRRLVDKFRVRERFFHFEFFRRRNGALCALEVNIRPPGGFTLDMFNYSCDIDVYAAWARVMTGKPAALAYKRNYHCCYIGRKYRLAYRHTHQEIINRLGPMLVQYQELPPVLARAMGDCGYIVRAQNQDAIMTAIKFIQQ
ncbi:MAG: carboxylate--amine ligase [Elusimicrobia bacterium RIFOXYA2_FULL_58_8]|nr:MAG: carboxylate--amine ligase [Elusimicrobia bacterium RIFOXYA12_FULL_57_11]OGS14540.1 MAG: carboxylate--amine ligase [Elusimicrobia bacterium RIFOXYA2_FULL_58_8]